MCLSSVLPQNQLDALLPTEPFYAYKVVNKRDNKLVSPVYSQFQWSPGEHHVEASGDGGFYVCLVKPGHSIHMRASSKRVIRIKIDPKDVVKGGPDVIDGHACTCLIVRKLTLDEQDYVNALNDENQNITTELLVAQGTKIVEKAEAKIAKRKVDVKVKKPTKPKKNSKAESLVNKATKKIAKKKAKKVVEKKPTMKELKATAKILKISGYSKLTHAELTKALKKYGR